MLKLLFQLTQIKKLKEFKKQRVLKEELMCFQSVKKKCTSLTTVYICQLLTNAKIATQQ
jgi:hypothetical protein